MKTMITKAKSFSLLAIMAFYLIGCRGSEGEPIGGKAGRTTISISGAWALYPMMIRWQEEFQKSNPGIDFDISAGGAGKGMSDVLVGAVDIGMVSRDIYNEEIEKGAFWISVTRDAVFLTVNENNPVLDELRKRGVSRDTLIGIYITGEIGTWGQVVHQPQILDPIHVFTRSDAAGAPATWAAYLGMAQEDLRGIGVYGDPGVLDAVIKDPLGVGYNNLNYAYDASTGLSVEGAFVVPIDVNSNGLVDSEEFFETKEQAVRAVAEGRYPSPPARDLNLVTLGKPSGQVKSFIQWILTEGQEYVDEAGYIRLSERQLQEQRDKLE